MLPVRFDQLTGQVGGVAEGRITATARLLGRGSGPRRGGGLQRKIFVNKVEIGFVLAAFYLESLSDQAFQSNWEILTNSEPFISQRP